MKKTLFTLGTLGAVAVLAACSATPDGYTVKGTLPDATMDGKTIYIKDVDKGVIIDSTVVRGNTFVFEGETDTATFANLSVGNLVAMFALENGQVVIGAEGDPTGTWLNDEMTRISSKMQSLNEEYSNAYRTFEGTQTEWVDVTGKVWEPRFKQLVKESFRTHENDVVGYFVARFYMNILNADERQELVGNAGPWLSRTKYVSVMKEAFDAQAKTAVGKPYADIKGTDINGNPVSLSDYVGKGNYVLVDMWASWCGPCKREIPNLANLHNLYKDKGLTVIGIYVWDELEKLAPTMEKEGITWPQIIDTADRAATKAYGVQGIPCIMLIGPDGTILDRTNLRGEDMQPTVEKFMFGNKIN